jgi:hypothetical protein
VVIPEYRGYSLLQSFEKDTEGMKKDMANLMISLHKMENIIPEKTIVIVRTAS